MLAHGQQDPVVPMPWASRSRDYLEQQGYAVDWHDYPMPHAVCPEEIGDIRDWIVKVLAEANLVKSNGEARRMIKQNAVKVDGDRVEDENLALRARPEPYQVQVGRRAWARVTVAG